MRLAVAVLLVQIASGAGPGEPSGGDWSLVVMFDVSASMRLGSDESEALLRAVGDGLVARLTPQDRVRIGAFASEIRLPLPDTERQDAVGVLEQSLTGDAEWRYGPSRLWDAVDAASTAIATDSGRRVVVVVSDGAASGNELSRAQVAANLRARGVNLWMIRVGRTFGDDRLRAFVTAFGGRVFNGYPGRPDPDRTALAGALTEILEVLTAAARE
jgi:hypothetical protein